MDNLALKDVIELGATGLQIIGLYLLWNRLTQVTDRLFSYLEDARRERHELRNQVQVLRTGQEIMQRGMNNE